MIESHHLTRRDLVACLAATTALALVGCGQAREPDRGTTQSRQTNATAAAAAGPAMTVYRDPSCGCCGAWADLARQAGYQVNVVNHPDMPAIKLQHGVPEEIGSCHTTVVGGYVVEGHVPLSDVDQLLKERPAAITGIAVAGMPRGSPGMETPDGTKDSFQVMAFAPSGKVRVYRG